MINESEIQAARHCITYAMANGADAIRVTLNKSTTDGCTMFNGTLDKVTHSADRSIYIYIFADGRYGTFSTNRFVRNELEDFIRKAISMVRMLGKDECRTLPDPARTAKDAVGGKELELYDESFHDMNIDKRLEYAARLSVFNTIAHDKDDWKIISEECEYSDSIDDTLTLDSQGFEGRHTETAFTCFTEMTVETAEGDKFSGHWWESAPFLAGLDFGRCGEMALERAVKQINPMPRRSGHYKMVVDTNAASRLISPLFAALNASAIQQNMSFLADTAGKKVFGDELTVTDMARTPGKTGSRMFDTEGVATEDRVIIEKGTVATYFVNTYMSHKTGMPATIEDISRPCIKPFLAGKDLASQEKELSLNAILRHCSNGILVTGFNGGNCNPVTGDFSFGIEGFAFRNGKVTHPVREMLITGNMMTLWNSIIAAGNDARDCTRWQIPTLAFENVSFSS